MTPRLLHVSADYPDVVERAKTKVVARHLELTRDRFHHDVLSLNRRTPSAGELARRVGRGSMPAPELHASAEAGVTAISYAAPPRGLLHRTMLARLGDWTAATVGDGRVPDLLVAWKLTVEGLLVHRAAQRLARPYALVVQGNTDEKILRARPDLRRAFARVWQDATVAFCMAPWTKDALDARLGPRTGATVILPCPLEKDRWHPPRSGARHFVSAFRLDDYRNKGLSTLASASAILSARGLPFTCHVLGGGSQDAQRHAARITASAPGIVLAGYQSGDDVARAMNEAAAFVLPSRRESFGLVFIEALMAGTPVIYPRGAAIDGYFTDAPFAVPVDALRLHAVAEAMAHCTEHQRAIKQALARWQESDDAQRFTRPVIARQFGDGLDSALN